MHSGNICVGGFPNPAAQGLINCISKKFSEENVDVAKIYVDSANRIIVDQTNPVLTSGKLVLQKNIL